MPAVRKDLPPGRTIYDPVLFTCTELDLEFEVTSDSQKVHCTVCLTNNSCEPWIHQSSATAHLGGEWHNCSVAVEKQQIDEVVRDNKQWKEATSGTERLFNNSFVPTDAVPNVQVTMNEPISVSS